jgi:transposase
VSINLDTCTKEELIDAYKSLAHELAQIKRMLYGAKSERFIATSPPDQLRLSFTPEQESSPEGQYEEETQIIETKKPQKKNPPVRQELPAHLPRKIIELKPTGYEEGMKWIGTEVTEVLDHIPQRLQVIRYERPKYLMRDTMGNEKILIADLPCRAIDKGKASAGLLASVITDKYLDHLPLYRQSERFAREEVKLSRSTLSGWVGQCSNVLKPLYEELQKQVLNAKYLQVDESSIKVMTQDKEDSTIKGCMQIYHAVENQQAFYLYTQTKEKENLLVHLKSYEGNLQVDGNVSYEEIKKAYPKITVSHCMAHARRYFEKALDNDHERATHALTEIQRLYVLERRIKEEKLTSDLIQEMRKQEAIPILEELRKWLEKEADLVLPKSAIGNAIAYALKRWKGLCEYAQTGHLQIDNNLVENIIRPLALGRKNYLFAGSHEGARWAATFYSFIATCKLHDVNPYRWLRDVLIRIQDHPVNRIAELLPLANYQYQQREEEV